MTLTHPVGLFGSSGGAVINPTATFINNQVNVFGTSPFNFTIPNFGGVPPAANRVIVVGLSGRLATGLTSVTIAGISATIETTISNSNIFSAIASAVVPTGTGSFSVNVVYTGGLQGSGISVYGISDVASTTSASTGTAAGNTLNITTTSAKAAVIAFKYQAQTASITWGGTLGMPSSGDATNSPAGDTRDSSNHINLTSLQTSKTITATGFDRPTFSYVEFN